MSIIYYYLIVIISYTVCLIYYHKKVEVLEQIITHYFPFLPSFFDYDTIAVIIKVLYRMP
jgi:hypothetical protein